LKEKKEDFKEKQKESKEKRIEKKEIKRENKERKRDWPKERKVAWNLQSRSLLNMLKIHPAAEVNPGTVQEEGALGLTLPRRNPSQ